MDFQSSIPDSLDIIDVPNPNLNPNPTDFKTVIDVAKDSSITLFSNPISNPVEESQPTPGPSSTGIYWLYASNFTKFFFLILGDFERKKLENILKF